MSNKLLLNLLQQKAQRQAHGGCMNGGVFTKAQREQAKQTRALNTIIMDDYINNTYGELSKTELKAAKAKYKRDQKILKKAQPKVPRVRDPNQPRKKYPRKPNINEGRIEELMRDRKMVDICGFTPASLRKKGQEQRISDLEATVRSLMPLRQIKKNKQKSIKYDPEFYNPDMAQFEDLVEEVKEAVAEQQIPVEVAEILIDQIENGELSTVAEVAKVIAVVADTPKRRGRKPKAKTGAGRYYY